GYAAHNPALGRRLEELLRLGIHPLTLGGLSKDAVVLMLNDLSQRQVPDHLVDVIFEASQGNPFFVEELYRHLLEGGHLCDAAGAFRTDLQVAEGDVPDNVRAPIGRWLGRVDAQVERVLAAAAVIGRSFSFGLLSVISQIDVEALFTVI